MGSRSARAVTRGHSARSRRAPLGTLVPGSEHRSLPWVVSIRLVLDEPTNARSAAERGLRVARHGAVVSHDRDFLGRDVTTRIAIRHRDRVAGRGA